MFDCPFADAAALDGRHVRCRCQDQEGREVAGSEQARSDGTRGTDIARASGAVPLMIATLAASAFTSSSMAVLASVAALAVVWAMPKRRPEANKISNAPLGRWRR